MTKTEFAFRDTARTLFETYGQVYFWTFTMRDVLPDWAYSNVWKRFARDLCDLYGGTLRGVKVVEMHQNHGLHWHALLNKRVWVGSVRRLGKRYGIGRVHVVKADPGAIDYLSKYLSKQWKDQVPVFAKMSRWGSVGGFRGCRVKDVAIESPATRRMDIAREAFGKSQIPFGLARIVCARSEWSDDQIRRVAACWRIAGQPCTKDGGLALDPIWTIRDDQEPMPKREVDPEERRWSEQHILETGRALRLHMLMNPAPIESGFTQRKYHDDEKE